MKIPLFTSAYSLRSILTLNKPKPPKEGEKPYLDGSDSIFSICAEENIKDLYLIEDNIVGFLEAKENCGTSISLRYGLRISVCNDECGSKTTCKYVVFCKNDDGYFKMIDIFATASRNGGVIKFCDLKKIWNNNSLILVVPFYDSYIHRNNFYIAKCIPDFSFCKPVFFIEENGLVIDEMLADCVRRTAGDFYETVETKTIYYKNKRDFLAWQTYKCIVSDGINRNTLERPNLEGCMSDRFCVESWKGGE